MNRFFVEKKYIGGTSIEINTPEDVHHLKRVLRIPVGEEVFISDGEGGSYIAKVSGISKASAAFKIVKRLKTLRRSDQKVLISLACAVPKNAHFEDIVDKCTQLGVSEIIPLITERTLVKKEIFDKKTDRLKRVAISAAKQSGILFLPQIKEAIQFQGLLQEMPSYDLCLFPNLSKKSVRLKDAVGDFGGKNILVAIGPEGDFTPKEIKQAFDAGCIGVSLGESVLRVDTAAICAVGYLRLYFGL